MNKRRSSVFDGILGDNIVLSSLMVISPVIICGDTFRNAAALIYAFSAITFLSVLISSFVPKKLSYTVKVIMYAVISSLVYIPVKWAAQEFFPGAVERIGIYFPLLAVNSLIIFRSEAELYKLPKGTMILKLIFYILGFDAVMLITGFVRELFAYGTINGRIVDITTPVSGLAQPFGGFIFLGLFCGLYRWIRSVAISKKDEIRSDADVSGK
ncbi:MAG: electron transport complex subunit E [Ruminococcus sp.]|mgnify:CR=1 FL=1|nr:electron transport complex subunit E [Ruminococcus sp.]